MSLAIDVEKVTHVLLSDGWHLVEPKTFTLDAYEFLEYPDDPDGDGFLLLGGGQSGMCATGFAFREGEFRVSGPLTALIAVREQR